MRHLFIRKEDEEKHNTVFTVLCIKNSYVKDEGAGQKQAGNSKKGIEKDNR